MFQSSGTPPYGDGAAVWGAGSSWRDYTVEADLNLGLSSCAKGIDPQSTLGKPIELLQLPAQRVRRDEDSLSHLPVEFDVEGLCLQHGDLVPPADERLRKHGQL